MRTLYYRMKRIIAWLPVLWKDQDWDYDFLIRIIKFKLNRMADCIEKNNLIASCEDVAKEMREVVEHLDKSRDAGEYYPPPKNLPEWEFLGEDDKINPLPPKWIEYYDMLQSKEDEHWDAAWQLISKKGRGWWD